MNEKSSVPPECSWPSGHEWEPSAPRVQLQDDNAVLLFQECRWCHCERIGVPVYEVHWTYEGSP